MSKIPPAQPGDFYSLEKMYRIEINQNLQNTITEHFGESLDIYTDQDMYEQARKIILSYKNQRLNKDKRY